MEQPRAPWWHHEAFIAWSLILFPPVGLYLMWKHAAWRNKFKWTWTVVMPLVWLLVVASAFSEPPEEEDQTTALGGVTSTAVVEESRSSPGSTNTPASQDVRLSPTPAPSETPESASAEEEAREAAGTSSGRSTESPGAVPELATDGLLSVYFFDVSLGDAIYVRTPSGEDVIIDGGDSSDELSSYLDALGETAIDAVITSHPHQDHIGGLARVIQEREVGSVWTNGEVRDTQVYTRFSGAISAKGLTEKVGRPGMSFALGNVTFSVLAPARLTGNTNNDSVVVRMDCGESSFLFTGDAETNAESTLLSSGVNLDVDVLKMGHHGSRTSTSAALIQASSPRLAIYSALPGNQYGHPHQETLDRLAAANVPVFGTGMAGRTVVVSTACDDQFSVSPQFEGVGDVPLVVAPPAPASQSTAPPAALQPTVPPAPQPTTPPAVVVQPTQTPTGLCHPSYQGGVDVATGGCIRSGVGDYDCLPGSGNGPNYVRGPVTVVGPDEFQLDTNDPDNTGCEP